MKYFKVFNIMTTPTDLNKNISLTFFFKETECYLSVEESICLEITNFKGHITMFSAER